MSERAGATRARAAEVVALTADLLRDPQRVAATVADPANADLAPDASLHSPWHPRSLAEGLPGVALLFAELGHTDPKARTVTHAYLRAASAGLAAADTDGLYQGLPAVAFTARAARSSPQEYERLLAGLDRQVLSTADGLISLLHKEYSGGGGISMWNYDLIGGLAGLGAYLLRAGQYHETLAGILGALVELAEPRGTPPGWWVWHTPVPGPSGFTPPGHLNLGMAHGVSGLLALLAIAKRCGIQVPGQQRAIHVLAEWLLAQRVTRDGLDWWPASLTEERSADGARLAWCYGTPGVARALQLAGLATGERGLADTAQCALITLLERALDPDAAEHVPLDYSLCHGWAGLLQLTWRMHQDGGHPGLGALLPRLALRVVDGFHGEAPFGYRYAARVRVAEQRAGFLEGAAGIALALHCYATDAAPLSGWDRALLLA